MTIWDYHPTLVTLPPAFVAIWAGFALRLTMRARGLRWTEPDLMRACLYAALASIIAAELTHPAGARYGWAAVWTSALALACWDDWRRWQR